jgi:RNA polymerase sigma factor (sigma-70 family)
MTGDIGARNELALSAWPLAIRLACRVCSDDRLHLDDRISAAARGLMDAAATHDPARHVPFAAWAAFHVRHAIGAALSGRPLVRVPQRTHWDMSRSEDPEKRARAEAAHAGDRPLSAIGEAASDDPGPLDALILREEIARLRSAVRSLPPIERHAIERRWGLGGSDPLTFRALGAELGTSPEQAFRIHRRALGRLRARLAPSQAAVEAA